MSKPINHLYEFGGFRLDPIKRLLLREGEVVALTPKAFDTLLALVENSGRVMEKDELMRQVWADTIVEEGGLTRNISVLRKALGESLEEHSYIVTVPGRGYRFVAGVRAIPIESIESGDLVVETHTISRIVSEFDAPLEITTSSLDALKAYSLGSEQAVKGGWLEAIPFYRRAAELDPNFAYAYVGLSFMYIQTYQVERAAESSAKAFALRERMSEREKLRIIGVFHTYFTGELEKAREALNLSVQTFPRDEGAYILLASIQVQMGQFEKSIEMAREALRLNQHRALTYVLLGRPLISLNRFADAEALYRRALEQKLDSTRMRAGRSVDGAIARAGAQPARAGSLCAGAGAVRRRGAGATARQRVGAASPKRHDDQFNLAARDPRRDGIASRERRRGDRVIATRQPL
jgi:DNA-binding winged helix-turn-helix (wHTH) protein